jgi:hypothetical protein
MTNTANGLMNVKVHTSVSCALLQMVVAKEATECIATVNQAKRLMATEEKKKGVTGSHYNSAHR